MDKQEIKEVFTVEELKKRGVKPIWFTQQEINKECEHPVWKQLRVEIFEKYNGLSPLSHLPVEQLHHNEYLFNADGTELHYYEYVDHKECLIPVTAAEHMKFHNKERKSSQEIKIIGFSKDYKTDDELVCGNYVTYDYERFRAISKNRRPDHVEAIVESMRKYGALPSVIYVMQEKDTELLYIIDGGNRFEAFCRLGLPITYCVVNVSDLDVAAELLRVFNTAQKSWTVRDYIRYFALSGFDSYVTFEEYKKKYPFYSDSFMLTLLTLSQSSGLEVLRNGKFRVTDIGMSEYYLNFFLKLKDLGLDDVNFCKNNKLFVSLLMLRSKNDIDLSELYSQIKKVASSKNDLVRNSLKVSGRSTDYFRMIEDVLNYGKKENERRRLNY